MVRNLAEVRKLARAHTQSAIRVLAHIVSDDNQPGATRIAAAQAILDRGWGKVAPSEQEQSEGIQVVIRHIIEDTHGQCIADADAHAPKDITPTNGRPLLLTRPLLVPGREDEP